MCSGKPLELQILSSAELMYFQQQNLSLQRQQRREWQQRCYKQHIRQEFLLWIPERPYRSMVTLEYESVEM